MDPKYSNIFWHQGVKIFEEDILKSKSGRIRIAHLENDVTKAFLNVLQYCSPKVLRSFLNMIPVKDPPESFDYDFQITSDRNYREYKKKIMLSIISSSTPIISDPMYTVEKSIPDAAIFNQNTVILIESKTQSPLNKEQIANHIKHFLGSETGDKIITWEDLSEKLNQVAKTTDKFDKFLINQFTSFLELIGIAEFRGFRSEDFEMLDLINKIPQEDYLDLKRIMYRKVKKFTEKIYEAISAKFTFKPNSMKVAKVTGRTFWIWSTIYFHDGNKDMHVNYYPNINFNFGPNGIEFSLNAETKNSIQFLLRKISLNSSSFDKAVSKLSDFTLNPYFKLQYLPQDNFIWLLIDGYPKKLEQNSLEQLRSDLDPIKQNWQKIKHTLLYRMETKDIRSDSNKFFSDNEILHARNKNPNPNYAIRIDRVYPREFISQQKDVVKYFVNEVMKFNGFLKKLFLEE